MLRQFYGDILPASGYYCLALLPEGRHLWAESLDELVHLTEKHSTRTGVYFGTAAYGTSANRTQANVLSLQALRLDIDAGPEKLAKHGADAVYGTQQEAIAAVVAFSKAVPLPPTYLVSSGAGLHVYYCLDEAVAPDEWLQLAKGLSRLGNEHGLKIDPSVTQDSARILRPVGALHNNGARVSVLKRLGKVYSADELRAVLPTEPIAARTYDTSINDELDLSFQGPPSSAYKIAEHCGALRHVAETEGNVPEPYWRAMLGLVKRTVEGIEVAHAWSCGHPSYKAAEVERKFDAWSTGPTTCAEFAKHNLDACKECQFNGKVKSPINLGLMKADEIEALPEEAKPAPAPAPVPQGDPWDGKIPRGFMVTQDKQGKHTLVHVVQTEKESPTGDMVPVEIHVPFTRDIFWLGQWAEAATSIDTAQVTLHAFTGGRVKSYLLDQSLVASQSKLLEFLSGKAIHTTTHKRAAQAMQDYLKEGLQIIKGSGYRPRIDDHLGLRVLDDGTLVAVHGKHVIYPDGKIHEAMLDPSLVDIAGKFALPIPPSQIGEWAPAVFDEHLLPRARKHVEFMRRHYGVEGMERFQLAIMLGMASPLMPFVDTGLHSGSQLPKMSALSVSLFSRESARGKTTAVMAAVLAYGKPGELVDDSGKMGATDNGRLARLSLHGTMPSVMDEMGTASAASVANMVSAVANGAGRVKATQGRAVMAGATWSLINLITTNRSQRDMIVAEQSTSGAIQARLLEINCENMPEYDQAQRDQFAVDWPVINRECPGALGAVIHREICALGVSRLNQLVSAAVGQASTMVGADQTGRFQYRALGAMLTLQLILKRLGLNPFELPPMIEEFKKAYAAGNEFVVENNLPTDGVELLSRALQDMAPNTLITESETHLGRNSTKLDVVLNPVMPVVIKARHVKSTGRTYVSRDALRDWCKEHGISDRDIVRDSVRAGVMLPYVIGTTRLTRTSEMYSLTKGIRHDMDIRCKVYRIDTKRLYGVRPEFASAEIVQLHADSIEAEQAEQTVDAASVPAA